MEAPTLTTPFYRRRWFIAVLLLTISPLALIPLLTGKVYRKSGDLGAWVPVSLTGKIIYIILSFWLTLFIAVHYINNPENSSSRTATSTNPKTTDVEQSNAPEMCDGSDVADTVKGAIEESPASKLVTIKVEDFGNVHELYFDKKNNVRYCQADALLNSGSTKLSYKIFFGPSGSQAVEEQSGEDAYDTASMKQDSVTEKSENPAQPMDETASLPVTKDSETAPLNIDAANASDCREKGVELVRKGYDSNDVDKYCAQRYDAFLFCKDRELSTTEVANVVMSIAMIKNGRMADDPIIPQLVVSNSNDKLRITRISYVLSNASHQEAGEFDGGSLLAVGPGEQNKMLGQQAAYDPDGQPYTSVQVLRMTGCVP